MGVVRSVKNVTKGYSAVQKKVRDATSNDPWGPTGSEMSEIAAMTFESAANFYEIMDMLDKRLNDKGKNWRHVLKSLKVLDYCLHEGAESCVTWARKNVYIIKTLREFQYVDDNGQDVGQNVRTSAKELTSLILDEERLRSERSDRRAWKSRVRGIDDEMDAFGSGIDRPHRQRPDRRGHQEDDDIEYRLAIEASKAEAEEERRRRQRQTVVETDDDDLAKAIKLSQEEEELRRRELEESNAASLFDDTPTTTAQPAQSQPTGWNQGYQQQPAVDWFGNPVDQQQPMTTGFLNQQYAQPTGMTAAAQQNGFAPGMGFQQPQQQQQPQVTGYDQFGQPIQGYLQPQATALQMQHTMQPQQSAFQNNNPYGTFGQQQQQTPQNNTYLAPGNNNPWAQRPQSADAIRPQQTGSNNPFALNRQNNVQLQQQQQQQQQQRTTVPPTLDTLAEQRIATQFNSPSSTNNPIMNYQAPSTPQQQQQQSSTGIPQNPHHARLNALLAEGDGQDTFGNVGNLRIPAQHTAPGVFVNSAGHGMDQRLEQSRTGNNPFMGTQFTGLPSLQATATGYPMQQQQQQQQQLQANNNPFGGQPMMMQQQPQQQQAGWGVRPQQYPQQGGSLIDL
ncbi:hypothetical protein KEM54_005930 [Ascosphaera aggregata]|nr:hypothetical protein KEM54_005930 [Ascosphaera aggregata]